MTLFIKEQVLQKKLPNSVQKWINEFSDHEESRIPNIENLWKNIKLYDDLQNCILRCNNPSGLNEICALVLKLYKNPNTSLHSYVLCLYPGLLDSYITTSYTLDFAKRKIEDKPESNRYTAASIIESCVCALANFYALRLKEMSSKRSQTQEVLNLRSIQENGSFISDPLKLSNSIYESTQTIASKLASSYSNLNGRNQEYITARMLEEYVDCFLSANIDISVEETVAYQSLQNMFIFLKKFHANSHSQQASKLLYQSLRFIDVVLNRLDPKPVDTDPPKIVSLAIDLLVTIERLSTCFCYVSILMVANSLIDLWTARLGDLHRFIHDEVLSNEILNYTTRRMSQFDDTLPDLELGYQAESLADISEQPLKKVPLRSRGLSTALITNANFRPVVVPEDITVEDIASESVHSNSIQQNDVPKKSSRLFKTKNNIQQRLHSDKDAKLLSSPESNS